MLYRVLLRLEGINGNWLMVRRLRFRGAANYLNHPIFLAYALRVYVFSLSLQDWKSLEQAQPSAKRQITPTTTKRTNIINMKVAVIMGSTSDLDIMSQAIDVLEGFGVEVVKRVISAHRTPDLMCEFAKSAKAEGIGAIIAGAGGAAHVAGVVAGMTTVPVIGVPIQTKALGGMDSLLSIVQMPAGIPVATMAINGAKNAGLFAAQILALTDAELSAKLDAFRAAQTQKVLDATI